ncbi:MAG: 6-bladed beta-propeller [Tannerellaceae bacterium]|jgi:hypothetical protein|nr:6-bladed beta-propeller [Tannerellaceae bacterium]
MKLKHFLITLVAIAAGTACSLPGNENGMIEIEVGQTYPEKEIHLKEVAEISYVKLDASADDYLLDGSVVGISDKTIVAFNRKTNVFLFFSIDGKPLSHFNHQGGGPEDYVVVSSVLFDENAKELYVNDVAKKKLLVYSPDGSFKRTLPLPANSSVGRFFNFDNNSLLLYDGMKRARSIFAAGNKEPEVASDGDSYTYPFVRISKETGDVVEYIPVPEDFDIVLGIRLNDAETAGITNNIIPGRTMPIGYYRDGFLLYNQETDTVFYYAKNHALAPAFVRTPPIREMSPITYLNMLFEAGNYEFIQTHTLIKVLPGPLKTTYLARDKRDGAIYTQKIVFDDYHDADVILKPDMLLFSDGRTGFLQYPVDQLKEALADNKLNGKLRTITEGLADEDNDLLVLLKFKP